MPKSMLSARKTLAISGALLLVACSSGAETTLEPGRYEQTQSATVINGQDVTADMPGGSATGDAVCLTRDDIENVGQHMEEMRSEAVGPNCDEVTIDHSGKRYTMRSQCEVAGQSMSSQVVTTITSATQYETAMTIERGSQKSEFNSTWTRNGACSE